MRGKRKSSPEAKQAASDEGGKRMRSCLLVRDPLISHSHQIKGSLTMAKLACRHGNLHPPIGDAPAAGRGK